MLYLQIDKNLIAHIFKNHDDRKRNSPEIFGFF